MTMLETKEELVTALANCDLRQFDMLTNCLLAVNLYLNLYGNHDINVEVTVDESICN